VARKHQQSDLNTKWAAIKEEWRTKEMNKVKTVARVLTIGSAPIRKVDEFKYLGRTLEKLTMTGQLEDKQ
jgi:hypothetical protein